MQLGAIELLVIGFPENRFTGEIVPALADLVEARHHSCDRSHLCG